MADLDDDLSTPGRRRHRWINPRKVKIDEEGFGQFAELIARYMGSPAFLIWMTLFIGVWIVWNIAVPESMQFDEHPFILLTLMLSIEAAYSAPLILLAQNRQEERDRVSFEEDRRVSAQSRADMDFLAREIASLRNTTGDMATRDFVRSELRDQIRELLDELDAREQRNIASDDSTA